MFLCCLDACRIVHCYVLKSIFREREQQAWSPEIRRRREVLSVNYTSTWGRNKREYRRRKQMRRLYLVRNTLHDYDLCPILQPLNRGAVKKRKQPNGICKLWFPQQAWRRWTLDLGSAAQIMKTVSVPTALDLSATPSLSRAVSIYWMK